MAFWIADWCILHLFLFHIFETKYEDLRKYLYCHWRVSENYDSPSTTIALLFTKLSIVQVVSVKAPLERSSDKVPMQW